MQMADENLKLKQTALQMKAFNVGISGNRAGLDDKYKDAVEKLAEQHTKFMNELKQVRII